jgi:hypothetical protein
MKRTTILQNNSFMLAVNPEAFGGTFYQNIVVTTDNPCVIIKPVTQIRMEWGKPI